MTLTNRTPISREDVLALFVTPVERESVAFQTSTTIRTDAYVTRMPVITGDPTAGWYAEAAEIAPSDAQLSELEIIPRAVKGLSIISNELAADSSPEAGTVIGDGLARDTATRIDVAWAGNLTAPAPNGLAGVTGVQTAVGAFDNLDVFAAAIAKAQDVGSQIDSFLCGPDVALALSTLKAGTGSNAPLLGADATEAGQKRILGVDLVVSPAVQAGVVWGYDSTRVFTVLRQDFSLDVDGSPFFSSDRTAIRSVLRVGFGFPHAASIVRVSAT